MTLIVTRPDGVEHRRFTLTDQGLGGRELDAAARRHGHDRHLARQAARRPQGRSDHAGHVPGRGLRARAPRPQARAAGRRARSRRDADHQGVGPLSLRAARRRTSPSKATSSSSRRARTSRAIPATSSARPTRRVEPVRKPLDAAATTDADGNADVAVTLPAVPQTAKPLEAERHPAPARDRRPHHRAHHARSPSTCSEARIGIKPLFKGQDLDENQKAAFEVVMLDDKGKRAAAPGLNWQLVAPRHQLAVVPPRRLVELRARDDHAQGRRRHARRDRRRRTRQDRVPRRLRPLPPRGGERRSQRPGLQRRLQCRLVLGERRMPTAPRCSTSRSTTRATSRATPPSCASPPSRAARRSSPCFGRPPVDAGGRRRQRRRRGRGQGRRRLGSRRLRHGAPLPPDGRKPEAHAEPRHRRAVDRPRPGGAHAQGGADPAEAKIKSGHDADRAGQDRRPRGRRGGARHASPPSTSASSTSRATRRRRRRTGSTRSASWPSRSATSTAASSTACAPSAARCAPAATAAATWACRAARRSRRRSRFYSGIVQRRAPTAPPSVDFEMPNFNGTVRVMAVAWTQGQARPRHRATSSCATRWRSPPPRRAS